VPEQSIKCRTTTCWRHHRRRARHYLDRREWDHWRGTHDLVGPHATAVQEPLAAVVRFLDEPDLVLPGLEFVDTAGHTPGHTSVLVSDPTWSQRLLILGDVLHSQVQVAEPHWNFLFDTDAEEASETRRRVLSDFQNQGSNRAVAIAGGHFAVSVLGRLENGYLRQPLDC